MPEQNCMRSLPHQHAKAISQLQLADGLGMLVGQAAHAVLLWHGVLPAVEPVIEKLKQELTA